MLVCVCVSVVCEGGGGRENNVTFQVNIDTHTQTMYHSVKVYSNRTLGAHTHTHSQVFYVVTTKYLERIGMFCQTINPQTAYTYFRTHTYSLNTRVAKDNEIHSFQESQLGCSVCT